MTDSFFYDCLCKPFINVYSSDTWAVVDPLAQSWTSPNLALTAGTKYTLRVVAVNGAGLSAVHHTDGVVIDDSPPKVHAPGFSDIELN